ncbi:MAG TPA: ribbon-helix-helix protein, CopG family [Thermoanaerobaculia bacterium]|nr:ribbon-helix-helix protein, CopG family [Thermoanaerobaculia bacterium]
MKPAVTVRLDDDLERMLDEFCERSGRSRSEVIRDALRRQLSLFRFEQLRREVLPFAEARGYLTDEDVFRDVS